jgi:tetratricopeptide (TPR) repeat protein
MPPVDPYDAVSAVVELLETHPSHRQILDVLETNLEHFITADLNHRLVPFAGKLAVIDYSRRPLAALPASVAICALDRPLGRRLLRDARESLASVGDEHGWGYACFLEGLQDLGEGQLDSSERWWTLATTLLGNESGVIGFTDAHLALVAYQRGELHRAVRLGELSLFAAERRQDYRVEAIAAVYLAFFNYWVGDFTRAAHAVRQARLACERIAEPSNRYEMPLVCAVDAALSSIEGDSDAAEQRFLEALVEAERMHNEWYRAITLSARALLTAANDPLRAVADATEALDYFDRVDERWWVAWATNSLAVAHLAAGEHHAGLAACSEMLAVNPLSPLERARGLCTRAELQERTGELSDAAASITEAIECFDNAGAHFWAARAEVVAAAIDLARSEYHLRSARRRSITDPPSAAWSLMLRGRGRLGIRLLGTPLVTIDSHQVKFKTRAELEAVALLTIAASAGLAVDDLADALWPDADWKRVSHRIDNLSSSLRRTLLPTTRLTRTARTLRLHIEVDECDYLTAMATAARLLTSESLDERSRTSAVATLDSLSQPLLGGPIARWVIAHQAHIDGRADHLRQRLASELTGRRHPSTRERSTDSKPHEAS